MKCGASQLIGRQASLVASGRMNRLPPDTCISTTRVTLTSPICQLFMNTPVFSKYAASHIRLDGGNGAGYLERIALERRLWD
jgi:hypothetical protein